MADPTKAMVENTKKRQVMLSMGKDGKVVDETSDWRELPEVEAMRLQLAASDVALQDQIIKRLEAEVRAARLERAALVNTMVQTRIDIGAKSDQDVKQVNGTWFVRSSGERAEEK